ncbi:MAG: polymerase sigma-70 factor, subfamily [Fibrobacteres bacterium]|nr:polymerase sigma-70 factor, subfamily [Fibrobacterota bacterium]
MLPQGMEHFFRHESGRIVSILAGIFGMRNLQLAEDVVQEALMAAFSQWTYGPIPDNPSAWVMTVAKRKALNHLKREKLTEKYAWELGPEGLAPGIIEQSFQEDQVEDSVLRMMFVCCHPDLPPEARLVLTLKIICGFSVQEIASALLSNESAIEKRLSRSKQEFRDRHLPMEIPEGASLENRLRSVHLCIYLLFNEGYNSSHPDFLIRKDLCMEAMRLCKMLLHRFPSNRPGFALMALMCFHAARFESRIDDHGALILFANQDRSKWNADLIRAGHYHLSEAAGGDQLTEYHLEAAIAAEHCTAKDFASTRWAEIDRYYEVLGEMKDNPVIELNRAVILSQTQGPLVAIKKLDALKEHPKLKGYYLLHATLGELYSQVGETGKAKEHFLAAIGMTSSKAEVSFLRGKLGAG